MSVSFNLNLYLLLRFAESGAATRTDDYYDKLTYLIDK